MSVTSVQFVGLFVVMMNSGAGLHILLPHFPGTPFSDHVSVIQYNPSQIVSSSWPGATACGPDGSLRCVAVDLETITFSGALDPAPVDVIGNMPHLRCCCPTMTDILPKYKNPLASGKLSAHIFVEHGIAEAMTGTNGRTDTWVTMHSSDSTGVTLHGSAGTSTFSIVFKPSAQLTIMNTTTPAPPATSHFLAYYLMGIGSEDCTSTPLNDQACAPRPAECPLTKVKISAAPKRRTITQSSKKLHAAPLDVDSNCSNSHWP